MTLAGTRTLLENLSRNKRKFHSYKILVQSSKAELLWLLIIEGLSMSNDSSHQAQDYCLFTVLQSHIILFFCHLEGDKMISIKKLNIVKINRVIYDK